jgi:hypothetical protein
MSKQTKWNVTGQVESVETGQKKDKVKFGKGEMRSTICMDAGESKDLVPGDKLRVTLEIDPTLDFGETEE